MPHIPFRYAPKLIWHGTKNYFGKKPVVVSFETTLSCNANCKHCDLGLAVPNENRIKPEQYRQYIDTFMPPVIQLSGGEPLLRKDLLDIVRNVKINPYFPYTILVTNGWLLNTEKYRQFRDAGVNQFSISLDFPDERHDEFRVIKGLYQRLNEIIPELAAQGHGDVVLNTAITSANVHELEAIIENARRWGVCLSFSVYTPLRTDDPSLVVTDPVARRSLVELFDKCRRRQGKYATVVNSCTNLDGILTFIQQGTIPHCSAGCKFLVVRPDGLLNPCSLQRVNFNDQASMLRDFTDRNECGGCYVSIRSYVEISFRKLLWENVSMRVFNRG